LAVRCLLYSASAILAAFYNLYNAQMVFGAKCAGMEEIPKFFDKDKRNLNH